MAQPIKLCKLVAGKALGAFPDFVATFNWLVDFCANLKGEGEDAAASESAGENKNQLRVDRTVSDHPVIRGGGSGKGSADMSTFVLKSGDDSNVKFTKIINDDGEAEWKIDVYYV